MQTPKNSTTKLAEVSKSAKILSTEDRLEMAAFGALIDWELVNLLGDEGWVMLSQSFRWRDDEVLMVVKMRIDQTQYVVFVSRQSPMDCVRTLVRKMRAGTVAMYPDKFQ